MKHTEGPWAIDHELPPNTRSIVARTTGYIGISANTNGPHNENEDPANARLIAAAPEMLEACKEARSILRYLKHNPMGYNWNKSDDNALMSVEQAIAKASD